jgi:hypothetical protein
MFAVRPEALDDFADAVGALGADAATAAAYARRHLTLSSQPGLIAFSEARDAVEAARASLDRTLGRLDRLCAVSAAELRASAESYRRTDDAEDRRLDATYPAPARR